MIDQVFESCVFVPGFSRTECASWVQAIGSVIAICVAIFIAWYQAKQTRLALLEQEAQRITEKVAPALAIIQAAIDDLDAVYSDGLARRQDGMYGVVDDFTKRHKWYAQAFEGIEPHTMPSVESTKIVLSVRELFRRADVVMGLAATKFNNMLTITSDDRNDFNELLAALRQQEAALKAEAIRVTLPFKPVTVYVEGDV